MKVRQSILFFLLSVLHVPLSAQPLDTTRTTGILPVPIIFYTPETGVAGGAAVLYFYRPNREVRPSLMSLSGVYTAKKQYTIDCSGELYLDRNQYKLDGGIGFNLFPQTMYGVGNRTSSSDAERYTARWIRGSINAQTKLTSSFSVGITAYAEERSFPYTESGGFIATHTVPGSTGGTLCGIGLISSVDTRDNIFSSHQGLYYQYSIKWFDAAWGSDYRYSRSALDLRNFFLFSGDLVLATQLSSVLITGDPPFYSMALMGGQNLMRGYFEGRFRDRNYLAAQTELRIPVWNRIDVAFFAGAGEVFHRISDATAGGIKPSAGLGLRYMFEPKERLKLRFDMGFGERGSSGFYVAASEAF